MGPSLGPMDTSTPEDGRRNTVYVQQSLKNSKKPDNAFFILKKLKSVICNPNVNSFPKPKKVFFVFFQKLVWIINFYWCCLQGIKSGYGEYFYKNGDSYKGYVSIINEE